MSISENTNENENENGLITANKNEFESVSKKLNDLEYHDYEG